MKPALRVVISGGGAVGLFAAALFATLPRREQLAVTVVDAGDRPLPPGDEVGLRVSALSAGSLDLLAGVGAREPLAARECAYTDMRVWDALGDAFAPDALHFSAAEMALPSLGSIVEDAHLRHVLTERLEDLGVELRFGAKIETYALGGDRQRVTLAGGETLAADLLLGADGANSAVRDAAGIDTDGWRYRQAAVVAHVRPQREHRHTAWQRFLASGPLALLPLADGRVSIVWSTSPDEAAELAALDDDAFSARLSAASDHVLGSLTPGGGRGRFPLRAQHARRYVAHGLALVGDAAHTVHPLAGQGANLGIADAAAIARIVDAALANGEHPADLPVLRRYERERRGANATMLYFIDGLYRLFTADSRALAALRTSGIGLFNASGPLKRGAMRVALGFDAGLPGSR